MKPLIVLFSLLVAGCAADPWQVWKDTPTPTIDQVDWNNQGVQRALCAAHGHDCPEV